MNPTPEERMLERVLLFQGGILTTAPAGPIAMYALGEPTYKLAFFAGFAACAIVIWLGTCLAYMMTNTTVRGDADEC